jgi:segregation and condensation protein B
MLTQEHQLKMLIEAILFSAGKPMTAESLLELFTDEEKPELSTVNQLIVELQQDYQDRGIELVQVASGYRFQAKSQWAIWIGRLFAEKAPKYSRALLETLALIAYRQPITRGEIEEIRGVTLSSTTLKTLLEDREWIRIVGHKEVPGRPALYATTKQFLDYFGLKTLKDLPLLPEVLETVTMTETIPTSVVQDEQNVESYTSHA